MIHLTYVRKHTCGLGDTEKHKTKFQPVGSIHSVGRQKETSKHTSFQGAITSGKSAAELSTGGMRQEDERTFGRDNV